MRILITGGTGLIGRQLCKALLAEGHELTVFSRNPASVPVKCGAGVHAMASLAQWQPGQAFDAVINLAGEPIIDARWSAQRKQVLWESRVTLTEELVRHIAAAEHKPAVLLSGSAVGYYGNRGDVLLDEAAGAGEGFAAALCKAWEDAARVAENFGVRPQHGAAEPAGAGVAASHLLPQTAGCASNVSKVRPQHGAAEPTGVGANSFALTGDGRMNSPLHASNVSKVRVCLLRTAPVLSNDGGLLGRMLPPFRLGLGARLGDGKQWMSWVHMQDYVAMVLRLLRDPHTAGPYNMAAPQPVTNAEFTATLAAALHRPALFVAPAILLKLGMGERASLLLEGQRVLPRKMEAAQYRFAFTNLADALRDLLGK